MTHQPLVDDLDRILLRHRGRRTALQALPQRLPWRWRVALPLLLLLLVSSHHLAFSTTAGDVGSVFGSASTGHAHVSTATAVGIVTEGAKSDAVAVSVPVRHSGRQLSASSAHGVRVVVVNDIAGHFEVLAGVLTRLREMQRQQPDLLAPKPFVAYTGNPRGLIDNGLQDWMGPDVTGAFRWHPLNPSAPPLTQVEPQPQPDPSWPEPADLVICVSAELAPKVCKAVLKAVKPRLLVIMVHRADTHTRNARILSLYPAFQLMALAPHVANLSSHMLQRPVDWAMPVAPFLPRAPCESKACLKGFSIQGALRRFKSKHGNGFTRDYPGLWRRLLQLRAAGQRVPRVVVVGKGMRSDLMLPPELENRVAFHPWLRYPDFWTLIHSSYALVPAFGMPVYYESRISSTILASLLTCVPVIAERRLLDTYTFLSERHVFLREPGEDEAAAMVRVVKLPEAEIFARRRALCELREAMNQRADQQLMACLRQAVEEGPGAAKGP